VPQVAADADLASLALASRATAALSRAELSRRANVFHAKARGRRYDKLLDKHFGIENSAEVQWAVGDVMYFPVHCSYYIVTCIYPKHLVMRLCGSIVANEYMLCPFQLVGRVLPPPRTDFLLL
jgi:hypothetical protein